MLFNEAKRIKDSFGVGEFTKEEMTFQLIVTPTNQADIERYFRDYRVMDFNDVSAKSYTSNNSYTVMALWTDGVNIIHRPFSDFNGQEKNN